MASRLLGKVRKAERVHAEVAELRRIRRMRPTGVIWTHIDPAEPVEAGDGEQIVLDYFILSVGQGATAARCLQRVTADPRDLGLVFNSDGSPLGRVAAVDGHNVELVYDRSAVVPEATGPVEDNSSMFETLEEARVATKAQDGR